MNTKQIGTITETETMLSFLKLGYSVLMPLGDYNRCDYVVDINNHFYKIQAKKSNSKDNGSSFSFSCRSTHRLNNKCIHEIYKSEEIDYFVTVFNNKTYLIPLSDTSSGDFTIRIHPAKNKQTKRINFAEEYEIENVIKKILHKQNESSNL